MKRLLRSFTAFLALFWALPAAAQVDDYARNGPYLGLAGTWATYLSAEDQELLDLLSQLGYGVDVDDPLGLNARAGYRFHPHFAGELEFEWLSEADVEVSPVGTPFTLESFAFSANGKGYLLPGRFQPFALIGLGLLHTELGDEVGVGFEDDATEFAARFGAGFDFYLTRNFLASLDFAYVLPTDDLDDLDYIRFGWGFGYRF
jgi:opacity protein-like surface antigen